MNDLARIRALADQAAASANDQADPVTVGSDEWFALMDAIYDDGDYNADDDDARDPQEPQT